MDIYIYPSLPSYKSKVFQRILSGCVRWDVCVCVRARYSQSLGRHQVVDYFQIILCVCECVRVRSSLSLDMTSNTKVVCILIRALRAWFRFIFVCRPGSVIICADFGVPEVSPERDVQLKRSKLFSCTFRFAGANYYNFRQSQSDTCTVGVGFPSPTPPPDSLDLGPPARGRCSTPVRSLPWS